MDLYTQIKSFGYIIDVRGPFPLLIRGLRVWQFKTFDEAVEYALNTTLVF